MSSPLDDLNRITDRQNLKNMIDECPDWGSIVLITNYAKDDESANMVPVMRVAHVNETYYGTIGMLREASRLVETD